MNRRDQAFRSMLLRFVTGCGRLPVDGFRGLEGKRGSSNQFTIDVVSIGENRDFLSLLFASIEKLTHTLLIDGWMDGWMDGWNGMEWNGMEWMDGMEWNGWMEWNEWMEWMEWNGLEWNGMDWNGMEWIGMEWNGLEWNGMDWWAVMGKLPHAHTCFNRIDLPRYSTMEELEEALNIALRAESVGFGLK
jgi:hypothetical protein